VFAGGCTLAAAEEVCDADLDVLEGLVDKSLLRRRGERFAMLETIREFAAERLQESGDEDLVRRRHAEYFLRLTTSANLRALDDGPQDHQLVAREQGNLRAAIDWAGSHDEIELGLRLVIAAENFWATQSPAEGHRRTAELLDRAGEEVSHLRADALRVCASATYISGRYEEGVGYIEQSLELYRKLGDDRGIGHMECRLAVELARVGDTGHARELVMRALDSARRTGYRRGEAQGLSILAGLEFRAGNSDEAMELLQQGAAVAEEIGFTWWQSGSLAALGKRALELERLDDAERWAREALELDRRIGDRQGMVWGVAVLAAVAARAGRPEAAGRLWGAVEAEESRGRVGQWEDVRDDFFARHFDAADERFGHGRAEGRSLTLHEAAVAVLAEGGALQRAQ
jgi:non-specific serine/threonine protein kinase